MSARILSALLAASSVVSAVPMASPMKKRAIPASVPQYVVDYAPLVHLYSGEVYKPSNIGSQLTNTQPENNFTPYTSGPNPLTLDNLASLNSPDGSTIYLTATDNIAASPVPAWLQGVWPDSTGSTGDAISCAIITCDKGNGIVDAFYMYFYAYNWGGLVLNFFEAGDHVGDWEHNAIRFINGVPQSVWYSQHSNGEAYTYGAVTKQGQRPIGYSANGTHANYATPGVKDRVIPDLNIGNNLDILNDYTDAGPLWDPTLAAYYASYDASTGAFSAYDDTTPINWLSFIGMWGDKQYPDSDPRQKDLLDLHKVYKYVDGPTGPEDKNLGRTNICLDNSKPCNPMNNLILS